MTVACRLSETDDPQPLDGWSRSEVATRVEETADDQRDRREGARPTTARSHEASRDRQDTARASGRGCRKR